MTKLIITVLFLLATSYQLLTPSIVSAQNYTKEEYAVYNRCQFISPTGACPKPADQNPAEQLLTWLTSFFFNPPENHNQIKDQSLSKQKALVPEEIVKPDSNYEQTLDNTIRNSDGIYGLALPDGVLSGINEGHQTECVFNNSNLPDQVSVFQSDGQCPTNTGQ